jgi:hypothetical protein
MAPVLRSNAMRIGVGMCLILMACKEPGAADWPPVDASVGALADSSGGFTFGIAQGIGPDPGPKSCNADAGLPAMQCGTPPVVCLDGGIGVTYSFAQCASGACVWEKANSHCALFEGGMCTGDSEAGLPPLADGGIWAGYGPCAVPLYATSLPAVPCDEDAGDAAAACPLPHSVCLGGRVLYYDNGACVAGQCTWEERLLSCPSTCYQGACAYGGTSAAAFPN